MSIALVQTANLGSTSGALSQQTLAFGTPPTVGNTIVAWAWGWQGATHNQTPAFSDTGGNAYTVPAGAYQHLAADLWAILGFAPVANTGASFKVTTTQPSSTTSNSIMVVAVEFSGVAATDPLDGAAVGTAPGTTAQTFAPGDLDLTAGSLVAAILSADIAGNPANLTSPSLWSSAARVLDGVTFEVGEALYQLDPATPTNPTWTTTAAATVWAAIQFALLAESTTGGGGGGPAGGGGGGPGSGFQKPVAEGWT
jgi:hypothetical protein